MMPFSTLIGWVTLLFMFKSEYGSVSNFKMSLVNFRENEDGSHAGCSLTKDNILKSLEKNEG